MKINTIGGCLSILLSSIAFAQSPAAPPSDPASGDQQGAPQSPPRQPQGEPGAGPRGQGGQGGQGGQQFAQRLLQADANGDGKLNADELPPQLREQLAVIDINKDGVLDETEIIAIARTQGGTRGGRGGAGGAPQNFEGAMKQVNRAFKALNASALDASSRARDLEQIQSVQSGLLAAKGLSASVQMAPQAKAKYGDDVAKYQTDLRTQLIASISTALAIETAILAEHTKTVKTLLETLDEQEEDGHKDFQPEDDDAVPTPLEEKSPPAPAGAK